MVDAVDGWNSSMLPHPTLCVSQTKVLVDGQPVEPASLYEGVLLAAALLATVGLSALTIALAMALYHQSSSSPPSSSSSSSLGAAAVAGDPSSTTPPESTDDDKVIIPWNPKYRVPNSYKTVGDRSDQYVLLQQEMDWLLPPNHLQRSLQFVQDVLLKQTEKTGPPIGK
jgi:hypothetical protein